MYVRKELVLAGQVFLSYNIYILKLDAFLSLSSNKNFYDIPNICLHY